MSGWQESFQPIAASGVSGGWQSSFQPNNYAQNVGQDWNNTKNKIGQLWADQQTLPADKQINPASTGLQMLGAAAGGAYAPAGEAIRSGYNSLPKEITQPINSAAGETAQKIEGAYNSGVSKLADTGPGQAIGDYLMNSPHIQNGMQEVSDDAKALANVLTLAKVKPALGEASEIIGKPIYASGKGAEDAIHAEYIQDLVLPKKTPSVQADMALRTEQINGKNIYKPSPEEAQVANTISQIPNVGKSNSAQGNLSLIRDANTKEAEALKARLQANNVAIPDDTIQNALLTIQNTLPKATNISAPGEATIARVINAGLDHITSQPQTASGMLEARKAFDRQMIREKGEGILDPAIESPRSNAVAAVRQVMNKIVADAVPAADVLQSLQKQNHMFTAMDNIAPKAAGEAKTAMGRALQRVTPHNLTGAIGNAGIGAAAIAASHYIDIPPSALAAALAGTGLYKGATAPTSRMLLGKALGGG